MQLWIIAARCLGEGPRASRCNQDSFAYDSLTSANPLPVRVLRFSNLTRISGSFFERKYLSTPCCLPSTIYRGFCSSLAEWELLKFFTPPQDQSDGAPVMKLRVKESWSGSPNRRPNLLQNKVARTLANFTALVNLPAEGLAYCSLLKNHTEDMYHSNIWPSQVKHLQVWQFFTNLQDSWNIFHFLKDQIGITYMRGHVRTNSWAESIAQHHDFKAALGIFLYHIGRSSL